MMKNATIAAIGLLCALGAATAVALIRPSGQAAPATSTTPCNQPAQQPIILKAVPAGQESPFLLPHYHREVAPGPTEDRTTRLPASQAAR